MSISRNCFTPLFFLLTLWITNVFAQDPFYINYNTKDGLPSSQTYDAFEDEMGYMWFTTDRGVVRYDGYDFRTFTTKDGLASLVNFNFYKGEGNTFWVNGYDGSLSFWDGQQFNSFIHNDILKKTASKTARWFNIININDQHVDLIYDNNDGLPKEFFKINRLNGALLKYPLNKTTIINPNASAYTKFIIKHDKSKVGNEIHNYIDLENNFWKLTRDGAIMVKADDTKNTVHTYFQGVPISSIFQTLERAYWFTTLDKGLFYVPSLKVKRPYLGGNRYENYYEFKIVDNHLVSIVKDKSLYLVLNNKGEFLFCDIDKFYTNSRVKSFFGQKVNSKKFKRIGFMKNAIEIDSSTYFLHKKENIRITKINDTDNFLMDNRVKSFSGIKDYNNNIWVGTLDNLLKIDLNVQDYSAEKILINKKDTSKIRVNALALDKNGFWIGTLSKGLYYKINDTSILVSSALLDKKSIECLYKQNDSTLWVGTKSGLYKVRYNLENFKPSIKGVEGYTTNDGLGSNVVNDIIYWNNRLYIATDTGINFFDPNDEIKSKELPRMFIDAITINGNQIDHMTDKLDFNHNQNNIKVSYTGLLFNKKSTTHPFYRYKLNNDEWNYTNDRNVEYFFLSPGDYSFAVQCQNNDGNWSEVKTLQFSIEPHFSQLLSFRLFVLLIILSLLAFLIKRRIIIAENKVSKELRYKESELATLRNQMNPHFVFNSLNTLQDFIFDGNVVEANKYIGDFASLMRKSLEFSKMDTIGLNEELQFIENYLQLEKKRYEDKFEFEIKTNIDVSKLNPKITPLLVQPIVENAVKYAFREFDDEKTGLIEIAYLKQDAQTIQIEVIDNGSGFDLDKNNTWNEDHKSMGIQIIKQRLELMNQKYKRNDLKIIIQRLKKGTKVTLVLPLNI